MKHTTIDIDTFLEKAERNLVIDVRSPREYNHAHLPGAISMPLFDDDERAVVGTIYKQESREKAIKKGLDFFGPKMKWMIEQVEKMLGEKSIVDPSEHTVLVYCWRGGMRSGGVAWLLSLYGFKIFTLSGGYKSFRNWVLASFTNDFNINLLSGNTGTGKTEILQRLKQQNANVIDLEAIANHKGSAFGHIGMGNQPSQEMFENILAENLRRIPENEVIWMEDESRRIGHVNLPLTLWGKMLKSKVVFIDASFDYRLNKIVEEYGNLDITQLLNAISRIQKRLGGLAAKNASTLLLEGNIKESFAILLAYYDKYYQKNLELRKENIEEMISFEVEDAGLINKLLASCEAKHF